MDVTIRWIFLCFLWLSTTQVALAAEKGVGMWAFSGDKVSEVHGTWYYNWKPYPNGNEANFVPMIWGERDANESGFEAAARASSPYLLGFNEPDGCGSEAACMSTDRALQLWPRMMATGKKLGSPAVARDYNWLKRFLQEGKRRGYHLDFIAVHTYQDLSDPVRAANATVSLLDRVHRESKLPVWLTEFGALSQTRQENIDRFMQALIPQLNERPWLERYAWFSDHSYRGNSSSAIWWDNGELSETGQSYRDVQ